MIKPIIAWLMVNSFSAQFGQQFMLMHILKAILKFLFKCPSYQY